MKREEMKGEGESQKESQNSGEQMSLKVEVIGGG